jgi:hypothetical protein
MAFTKAGGNKTTMVIKVRGGLLGRCKGKGKREGGREG